MGASALNFGLAGLAAPQGVLGPEGTKRGRGEIRAPNFFGAGPKPSPIEARISGPGPKTQSGPCAERTARKGTQKPLSKTQAKFPPL